MDEKFFKAVASGNDFIIIDNRNNSINKPSEVAKKLCQRKFSIGADGLILIDKSKDNTFWWRIFNADGSEAEMCVNGVRCLALLLYEKENIKVSKLIAPGASVEAEVNREGINLKMESLEFTASDLKEIKVNLKNEGNSQIISGTLINTGVPHFVVPAENLDELDVEKIGSKIRYHQNFAPQGTNVDFVKVENENSLRIRTYERGVGETYSCGTGALASAIVFAFFGLINSPVKIITKSKEILEVSFALSESKKMTNIFLKGPAQIVYVGRRLVFSH